MQKNKQYRFILTRELGKLTRWLRILGFDSIYHESDDTAELIIHALRENRLIVTRRKEPIDALKKHTIIIDSCDLNSQLQEVKMRLNLEVDESKMFTRCTLCNEQLTEARKESIKEKIPSYVYSHHDYFMECRGCKRIYWQGTHWGNVTEVLRKLGITG